MENVLQAVRVVGRKKMQAKHLKDRIHLYKMKKAVSEDWTPNSEPTLKVYRL